VFQDLGKPKVTDQGLTDDEKNQKGGTVGIMSIIENEVIDVFRLQVMALSIS